MDSNGQNQPLSDSHVWIKKSSSHWDGGGNPFYPLVPFAKTLSLETAMTPKICPKMSNRLILKVKKVSHHVYIRKANKEDGVGDRGGGYFSGLFLSA